MAACQLVLHIGMGKTGSSALQVDFVRNREALAHAGVHYPPHASDARAEAGGVVSGNGLALLDLLAPRRPRGPAARDRALAVLLAELAASPQPTVLYSSEFLIGFRGPALRAVREAADAMGVRVRVVVYVRDVVPHLLSSYSQLVKRTMFTGTVEDYLDHTEEPSYRPDLAGRIRTLHRVLGPENVVVLHYGRERARLLVGFLKALGIEDPTRFESAPGRTNRSLTPREMALMRHMNPGFTGSAAARRASDALIAMPPLGEAGAEISRATLRTLEQRLSREVDWVNRHCFADAPLSVRGSATVVRRTVAARPLSDGERFLADCVVALANGHSHG